MRRNTSSSWIILLLFGAPFLASAAENGFSLEAAAGTSDNIARTAGGTESETIASLGTQFALARQSRRLDANLAGDLTWFDYLEGAFDSEVVGSAGATLQLDLVDDLLSWSFVDQFGQARLDVLAASTPTNREYLNQFSTGPDFTIPLGVTTYLLAASRYMRVDYEDSPFDSERYSHMVGLRRELSTNAELTLRGSLQSIDPADAPVYEIREAVVAYSVSGARTDLGLEGGVVQVQREGLNDDDPSAVVRLNIARHIATRSTLTLNAARESADAGGSLGGWSGTGLLPSTSGPMDLSRTTDPYVVSSVQLGWRIRGRVTRVELSGAWMKEEFDSDAAPDRLERWVMLTAARQLSPKLTLAIDARQIWQRLGENGRSRESTGGINLDWRLGRRLYLGATGEITRNRRNQVSGTSRENRYWLRLRYASDAMPSSQR